nr:PLP-dependent aminotransferase family protein [Arboricoccus pini]
MRASEIRELLKLLDQPDVISFAGGIPDAALFPQAEIASAYQAILAGPDAGAALQYSVSEGYRPLREWIVRHMRALGVPCGIDNIVITSGSQQALDFIAKLFLMQGDTALVTWPTYLGALQALNPYEPRYDKLPIDSNEPASALAAAVIDRARAAGSRPRLAYLVPDVSNPTGRTLDRAGRERLLDLIDALDIPLIEDAAYQALRFEGTHEPSLLALEIARRGDIEQTRTLYCGTFSKTLVPGLRVGWICAAAPVVSKIVLIKQAGDLHSATINQMVTHRLAESVYAAQVEKACAAYGTRRDAMLDALGRHMPKGVEWTVPEGGMFIWLTLPPHLDATILLAEAVTSERIAYVPGGAFFPDGSGRNTARLSFSSASPARIEEGISRLGRLIAGKIAKAA